MVLALGSTSRAANEAIACRSRREPHQASDVQERTSELREDGEARVAAICSARALCARRPCGRRPAYDLHVHPSDVDAQEVEARLGFLTASLEERQFNAALWYYGWLGVTTAGGGAIILALGDETDAAVSTALGLVVGEIRILTHPHQSIEDLEV